MDHKKTFAARASAMPERFGWTVTSSFISLLMSVPILVLFYYLFVPGGDAWLHLVDTTLPEYIINSLGLMALVAVFSTIIGVSCAWLVAACDFPGRKILSWGLVLPLAAPAYVIAYLYTDLLDFSGPLQTWLRGAFALQPGEYWFPDIRNLTGAALMLSLVLYPYIYLLARASFQAQAGRQFEAARTLGKTPFGAFFQVALPAARPAIIGGVALVLMETLADFGVVDYFSIPTFSTGIFRTWILMGEKLAAMKLAAVMLIFVIALIGFEYLTRRGRYDRGTTPGKITPMRLQGKHGTVAMLVCLVPFVLGFIIPVSVLTFYAVTEGDQLFGKSFSNFIENSLTVAVIAAFLACFLALFLAYAQRLSQSVTNKAVIRIATLGYALPGLLLAVGLLGPIAAYDRLLTGFMVNNFGWQGGLFLSGTIILLVYAYIIRFMTIAFNSVSGELQTISPAMDAAARSLGATPMSVMRRIHLPLLRPGLSTALLLVFVDVIRELPATLILRPFNFDTLATRVYRLASDERLAEASTAALAIVLIGLLPVIILDYMGNRERG